jgi:hypothetical protein
VHWVGGNTRSGGGGWAERPGQAMGREGGRGGLLVGLFPFCFPFLFSFSIYLLNDFNLERTHKLNEWASSKFITQ